MRTSRYTPCSRGAGLATYSAGTPPFGWALPLFFLAQDFDLARSSDQVGVFASALAIVLFYWLLAQMSPVGLTLFVYITPLVAIVSAWFLLGEVPRPRFLVGTGLVLTGILLCPAPCRTPRSATRP